MDFEFLRFTKMGNLGVIRLHRPEMKNAINFKMFEELKEIFTTLKNDSALNIIVLTGYQDNNKSFFSSGIDLNELQMMNSEKQDPKELENSIIHLQSSINSIEDVGKVVIAQVTGFCFGSALEIALACDFIIASEETLFGLLETKYGIIPDLGGTFRLVRRVGYQFAKQIIMLADRFDAGEAYRMGLINLVTKLLDIEIQTKGIVNQLNKNDMTAVLKSKQLIDQIHPIVRSSASRLERETQIRLLLKDY